MYPTTTYRGRDEPLPRLRRPAECSGQMSAETSRPHLRQSTLDVYANDCDEDVCMSWFLLKNHALTQQALNPALNRLVHMVDMLDTTAGAFPFPEDMPSL